MRRGGGASVSHATRNCGKVVGSQRRTTTVVMFACERRDTWTLGGDVLYLSITRGTAAVTGQFAGVSPFGLGATAEEVAEVNKAVPENTEQDEKSVEVLPTTVNSDSAAKGEADLLAERLYCLPGWIGFGSRCYLLVKNRMTWVTAEKHCAGLTSSLVSIRSPSEHQFLQSLLQMGGVSPVWTGGFCFQNQWMWVDQSRLHYTNWGNLYSCNAYPCMIFSSQGTLQPSLPFVYSNVFANRGRFFKPLTPKPPA
ncbi:ladderlectin-like [Arapaima gigas]